MTCLHVYSNVGNRTCPHCGRDTHETDWDIERQLRNKYYEEGKHLQNVCPVEGGTIRGWWSI